MITTVRDCPVMQLASWLFSSPSFLPNFLVCSILVPDDYCRYTILLTTRPYLASNMAGNNPNRRSLDLFNVDQQAVENLDLTFQENIPSSASTVCYSVK